MCLVQKILSLLYIGFCSLNRKYESEEVNWETWDSPASTPKLVAEKPAPASKSSSKSRGASAEQPKPNNDEWGANKWEDDAWEELNK